MPKRGRRRLFLRIAILVFLALAAVAAVPACTAIRVLRCRARIKSGLRAPARLDRAHLDVQGNMPILHLYGSPAEMGTQYGTLLKEPLRSLDTYVTLLVPDADMKRFLAIADAYEPVLPADIRDELQAMSQASGMPYRRLVALNTVARARCSALAMWGEATANGEMVMGRNSEYFSFGLSDRGSLIVVYHAEGKIPLAAVSFLGMVGAFTGVNEEGVAFGNLLVFNSSDEGFQPGGLPIQVAMRVAAEQERTARGMVKRLRTHKHVIPINVMVADPKEALVVELAFAQSHVREGEDGVLAVSNHFRSPAIAAAETHCRRYDALIAAANSR